jgi:hypothetical protein
MILNRVPPLLAAGMPVAGVRTLGTPPKLSYDVDDHSVLYWFTLQKRK